MNKSIKCAYLLFMTVISCFCSVAANAQMVVRLGTIAPEQSVWHDALLEIAQEWRDISAGEIELRVFAGGVLGGEQEMIRKLQRQSLDALAISGAGLPQLHEVVSCLNTPMLYESYEQLAYVRDSIAIDLEANLEQRGFKALGWAEAGWIHFFAKEPVRVPEDLRRQRLWISTGSPDDEALMNEFGFRVVALPATDMLTGLQSGLIDAIDVPPLFALVDRSYQYAEYMTDLQFAPLNSAVIINLRVWERIPELYRNRILEAVQRSIDRLRNEIQVAESEAIDEMIARGLQLVKLDEAAYAQWKALAVSAYPELSCSQNFPEIFARVLALQQAYSEQSRR